MDEQDLYRQLQRHLDLAPVPYPATESGVEIRILQQLFSPPDARVALSLSMIPERPPTIHKRLRAEMPLEQLQATLDRMADRGLIIRVPHRGGPRYGKTPFIVGFYEAQVNRLTEAFERDVLQYRDEAFGAAFHSGKTAQMRTVPVNRPMPVPERPIARYNDIAELVRSSPGPFAAMNCICKQGEDLLSRPCRATTTREHCLTFGMAARIVVEDRGAARYVTRDDVLGILERADRDGLVLQPENTQHPLFLCSCCGCCCGVLKTAKKFPRPADVLTTDYRAELDEDSCQQCGTCIGRCQMEAVAVVDGRTTLDGARCIGCGLCISTCPSGAMRLVPNERVKHPPSNTQKMYAQMFRDRFGPWRFIAAAGRNMIGMKT